MKLVQRALGKLASSCEQGITHSNVNWHYWPWQTHLS